MSTETEVVPHGPDVYVLAAADAVRDYVSESRSPNTRRAYRAAWADFAAWCERQGADSLPASAETVAVYAADRAGSLKVSTLQLRMAAISQAHQAAGHEPPTRTQLVRLTMAGIRRRHGTAQRQVSPATTPILRALVATCPTDTSSGARDRAMLLIGFAGAFRRSELVSIDVEDVTEVDDGLRVRLKRSKTDQEGAGETKGIPFGSNPETCPVRAWRAWIERSGIKDGPVFRPVNRYDSIGEMRLSGRSVALVIKRAARRAGLPEADYSGHSLRAGLATAAAEAGVPERDIMRQTGHRSVLMVRRYIREGGIFRDNAASQVGL